MKTTVISNTGADTTSAVNNIIETIRATKEKGEFVLDEFLKASRTSNFSRHDVLTELRGLQKSKEGQLIVGRRGHATRFVWGAPKVAKKHYRRATVVNSETPAIKNNYCLRLRFGNEVVKTIPLELDLVAA